jgi:hypothetical protein
MMTMAEVKMRAAHADWLEAKRQWTEALKAINIAKTEWEIAQHEFYGDYNAMTSVAGCAGCTGGCK